MTDDTLTRPEHPPQHIKAGDLYSFQVEIWFNSEKSGAMWIEVNADEGWGRRYRSPLVYNEQTGVAEEETIWGDFDVQWRVDSYSSGLHMGN